MIVRAFVSALLLVLLAGCGGTAAPIVTAPTVSPLNGNWWIAGDYPAFGIGQGAVKNFGIAATIDVIDGIVYASSTEVYPCTGSSVGGSGGLAPAVVASDGSFTLQTLQVAGFSPTVTVTVSGVVPKTAGGPWSGTYSANNTNLGCTPVAGTFTAVPIQPVTGTFVGSGNLGPLNSNVVVAATFAVGLQQTGPLSLDLTNRVSVVNSVNALNGTIDVTGVPCFTHGTTVANSGSVFGDVVALVFTMDDGSRLTLHGTIKDPSSSVITGTTVAVMGGQCDGWDGFFNASLTRQ